MSDDPSTVVDLVNEHLALFSGLFSAELVAGLRRKLGLSTEQEGDLELAKALFDCMAEQEADYTLTFRRLCEVSAVAADEDGPVRELFDEPSAFDGWVATWRKRLTEEELAHDGRQAMMRSVNPAFIPRNHLVEEVLQAAEQNQLEPFQTLMKVLAQPYQNQPDYPSYMLSPRPEQVVHQTFCGT